MTPWTVAHQALLSIVFPRQEYWGRLPFPSPGDLPDPGIKPMSPASPALAGGFFTTSATWEAPIYTYTCLKGQRHPQVCFLFSRSLQSTWARLPHQTHTHTHTHSLEVAALLRLKPIGPVWLRPTRQTKQEAAPWPGVVQKSLLELLDDQAGLRELRGESWAF